MIWAGTLKLPKELACKCIEYITFIRTSLAKKKKILCVAKNYKNPWPGLLCLMIYMESSVGVSSQGLTTRLAHGGLMWLVAFFLHPFLHDWPTNVCECLYTTDCQSWKCWSGHLEQPRKDQARVKRVRQARVPTSISICNAVVEKFFNWNPSRTHVNAFFVLTV